MKKLPSQISSEELLKALEDGEANERPTEHSVIQFINDFGIEAGDNEVNGQLLYKLYNYHIDAPVSTLEFHLIFTGYFRYMDSTNGRRYLLNRVSADLSRKVAEYLAARKQIKKTKNPHFRRHFESFIDAHGLQQGTANIPAQALFYYYDKWQYDNKLKTRLPYRAFIAMIRLYFETKRTTRNWCVVKINQSFLENKDLKTALEWGNKYNAKKKDITTKEKKK